MSAAAAGSIAADLSCVFYQLETLGVRCSGPQLMEPTSREGQMMKTSVAPLPRRAVSDVDGL